MTYLPGLILALAAFWFALSGETAPLYLMLAAASLILVLWLCARLKIIGRDASPYHRTVQLALYSGWLVTQIVKANIAVITRIVSPSHGIDPNLVDVRTSARTDLGKALFANAITLTPGTVTVDVENDRLVVHALVGESSPAHAFADMDRKAASAADGKA